LVVVKDLGKRNVLGVLVDAIDYEAAAEKILRAARQRRGFTASALAVHGVMTGVDDAEHGYRLNALDLVTPDGQPVRWALNALYGAALSDRVYGPTLMLRLCASAAAEGLPVFLYGSEPAVLARLSAALVDRFPGLKVAGAEPSKFRRTSSDEKDEIAKRIRDSGAAIVFVGLGCPRQEVFVYEYRDAVGVPLVAVGAAFDYHAGLQREPSALVQRAGLQWLHRLLREPGRLWKRYTLVSARYVWLLVLQLLGLRKMEPSAFRRPDAEVLYG
jgi:N-acetylglucosaminyldiphosphoundecaprenol N-acetyl-beta-D-mannosaminyltransferase